MIRCACKLIVDNETLIDASPASVKLHMEPPYTKHKKTTTTVKLA